ncbi:cytidine deaminase [Candidatus Sumerlaeota bacterium]|nr:cytidine deaminase [Candidatus Sumerlaeota bacterium]
MQPTDDLIARLLAAARSAQSHAYAPYSKFRVGAAIYTDHDHIITGCNVENASYSLTNCAERVAIGRIIVERAGTPLICVVAGPKPVPLTPCGACRQVMLEFNKQMHIIAFGSDDSRADFILRDLLPASFDGDALT